VADACGRLRTLSPPPGHAQVFEPGAYRLHNGCESIVEGAALIAPGHRHDDERRSRVEQGIRASLARFIPANSLYRLNQAAWPPLPVRPEQVWVDGSKSLPQWPAAPGHDAFREERSVA
jgi:hypothetical protein